jgi:hypothetical protein
MKQPTVCLLGLALMFTLANLDLFHMTYNMHTLQSRLFSLHVSSSNFKHARDS